MPISIASSEIAADNVELSRRTEMQAGSLQLTASSMEELTSTALQNTEIAIQANQLVENTSSIVVEGGRLVDDVVRMMKSIHASSDKIAEIIIVIDGIAFQTNILALNAAVEAARSGTAIRRRNASLVVPSIRGKRLTRGRVAAVAETLTDAGRRIDGLINTSYFFYRMSAFES